MKYILLVLLSLCSINVSAQQHELAAPNCELRTKPTPGIDAYCKTCGEKQQKEREAKQKAEEQRLANLKVALQTRTNELAAERTRRQQVLASKLQSAPKEGMIIAAPVVKATPVKEVTYSLEDKELLAIAEKGKLDVSLYNGEILFSTFESNQRNDLRKLPFRQEPGTYYHSGRFLREGYSIVSISKDKGRSTGQYAQEIMNIRGEFLVRDSTVKQILPCDEQWVLLGRQTRPGMVNGEDYKEIDKYEFYNWNTKESIPLPADAMSSHALKIGRFQKSIVAQMPLKINDECQLWDYKVQQAVNVINLAAVWDLEKMNKWSQHFCVKNKPMPADIRGSNKMLLLVLINNGGALADIALYGFDPAAKKLTLLNRDAAQYTTLSSYWFAEICR